jgi:GTP1/Obg family GTP-binding protein
VEEKWAKFIKATQSFKKYTKDKNNKLKQFETSTNHFYTSGFPSVGKSTLLTNLAGVYSEVAGELFKLNWIPYLIH